MDFQKSNRFFRFSIFYDFRFQKSISSKNKKQNQQINKNQRKLSKNHKNHKNFWIFLFPPLIYIFLMILWVNCGEYSYDLLLWWREMHNLFLFITFSINLRKLIILFFWLVENEFFGFWLVVLFVKLTLLDSILRRTSIEFNLNYNCDLKFIKSVSVHKIEYSFAQIDSNANWF